MTEIDHWLERLYWLALIALPFLLVWGGRVALRHVQTASQQVDTALQEAQSTKLLKILGQVEEQRVQDALNIVMTDIGREEEAGKSWWEGNDRLRNAATQVCVSYDHLGGVIQFDGPDRVGQYVLERWGEGIIRAHDILQRFLDVERKASRNSYANFAWLSEEAKLVRRNRGS